MALENSSFTPDSPVLADPIEVHPRPDPPYPIGCTPTPTVLIYHRRLKRRVWVNEAEHDFHTHGIVLERRDAAGNLVDDGGL